MQRWNVTNYIYVNTVLKCNFENLHFLLLYSPTPQHFGGKYSFGFFIFFIHYINFIMLVTYTVKFLIIQNPTDLKHLI